MTPEELVSKYDEPALSDLIEVVFKSIIADKQIATGEVYAPYVLDSHGEMMLPDGVETLAHRFLARFKNDQIDLMHNNKVVRAVVVESFIARKGDPDYNEGAWVLSVKIEDNELWQDIKVGKFNGFSMQAWVNKVEADVEIDYFPHIFGFTENADGHEHAFFIQLNDEGTIVRGVTSEYDDHVHSIVYATATEDSNDHAHRFMLP